MENTQLFTLISPPCLKQAPLDLVFFFGTYLSEQKINIKKTSHKSRVHQTDWDLSCVAAERVGLHNMNHGTASNSGGIRIENSSLHTARL